MLGIAYPGLRIIQGSGKAGFAVFNFVFFFFNTERYGLFYYGFIV